MLALVAQNLPLEGERQVVGVLWLVLAVRITQSDHLLAETGVMPTTRIDQDHLAVGGGMLLDKAGQDIHMGTLIEQIAADDQVKDAQFGGLIFPASSHERNRGAVIQGHILPQEIPSFRVVVGRRDVGVPLIEHQAGQGNPTADLEDPQTVNLVLRHQMGQHSAGCPDNAEQRPGGRRNAQAQGNTIHIGILLVIAQRAQVNIGEAKLDGLVANAKRSHR